MALISPTISAIPGQGNLAGWKITWGPMLQSSSDTGAAVQLPDYSDRSVQVEGTFGGAGNCAIEGSNNGGTNWEVLNDPSGTALNVTAASIKAITEASIQIRPHITAGDGTTSLTVTLFQRKTGQP